MNGVVKLVFLHPILAHVMRKKLFILIIILFVPSSSKDCNNDHCHSNSAPLRRIVNGEELVFIPDKPAERGGKSFSKDTLPDGLEIKASPMPEAGLGVFAVVKVKKGTMLGPYRGVRRKTIDPKSFDHTYSWQLKDTDWGDKYDEVIDGKDPSLGNYLRYVNHALDRRKQNMEPVWLEENIYYKSMRDIEPEEELLIYYGDLYHKDIVKSLRKKGSYTPPEAPHDPFLLPQKREKE